MHRPFLGKCGHSHLAATNNASLIGTLVSNMRTRAASPLGAMPLAANSSWALWTAFCAGLGINPFTLGINPFTLGTNPILLLQLSAHQYCNDILTPGKNLIVPQD